jgi:hypothetical protein
MATDEDDDEDADDDADEDEDEMIITAASSAYRNDSVRDLDLSVQRLLSKWGNRFLKDRARFTFQETSQQAAPDPDVRVFFQDTM